MNRTILGAFGVAGLVMLSGCAGPATMGADYGAATRFNQQLQAMNPDAGSKPGPVTGLDGQKAEQVIKAYRAEKGKTETVRLITGIAN